MKLLIKSSLQPYPKAQIEIIKTKSNLGCFLFSAVIQNYLQVNLFTFLFLLIIITFLLKNSIFFL